MIKVGPIVNGEELESAGGGSVDVINPATGEIVARQVCCNDEYVNIIVESGRQAFNSAEWQNMSPSERGNCLLRLADLVEKRADDLIKLELMDTGKPVAQLQNGEIPLNAAIIRFYAGASDKIAAVIRNVNRRNRKLRLDVLIVGRGGGSLEDLWAFNEEPVARAIYDSAIPVISAVGHEVDVTIADLVADARASTPTKAGMIAVPDMVEVLRRIDQAGVRLAANVRGRTELSRQLLATIQASVMFRNPQWIVNNAAQMIDERTMRLADSARGLFADLRRRLEQARLQVGRIEPHRLVGAKRIETHQLASRALAAVKSVLSKKQLQLTAAANRLETLDPRSVLDRGYSITTNQRTGKVITAAADVRVGDTINTELARQTKIESEVKIVYPSG